MIKHDASLEIKRIPLECILLNQHEVRNMKRVRFYINLLTKHPNAYAGVLHVEPSKFYDGLYVLLDGHHRFMASICTGRRDAICVVVEERPQA